MNVTGWVPGQAWTATITVGAESGDKILITIQLKDFAGNNLTVANSIVAYCASDVTGLTYATNDLTTDIAASTGTLAVTLTAGVYQLVSTAAGLIVLDAVDTAACTAFYIVLVMPNGKLEASDVIELAA